MSTSVSNTMTSEQQRTFGELLSKMTETMKHEAANAMDVELKKILQSLGIEKSMAPLRSPFSSSVSAENTQKRKRIEEEQEYVVIVVNDGEGCFRRFHVPMDEINKDPRIPTGLRLVHNRHPNEENLACNTPHRRFEKDQKDKTEPVPEHVKKEQREFILNCYAVYGRIGGIWLDANEIESAEEDLRDYYDFQPQPGDLNYIKSIQNMWVNDGYKVDTDNTSSAQDIPNVHKVIVECYVIDNYIV